MKKLFIISLVAHSTTKARQKNIAIPLNLHIKSPLEKLMTKFSHTFWQVVRLQILATMPTKRIKSDLVSLPT